MIVFGLIIMHCMALEDLHWIRSWSNDRCKGVCGQRNYSVLL